MQRERVGTAFRAYLECIRCSSYHFPFIISNKSKQRSADGYFCLHYQQRGAHGCFCIHYQQRSDRVAYSKGKWWFLEATASVLQHSNTKLIEFEWVEMKQANNTDHAWLFKSDYNQKYIQSSKLLDVIETSKKMASYFSKNPLGRLTIRWTNVLCICSSIEFLLLFSIEGC